MLSVTEPSRRAPLARERKRYARIPEVLPIPNLIELQLESFNWFIENGLRELLDEISPIQDFTGRVMELRFKDYEFEEPKYSQLECRTRDLTFSKPLYVWVELLIKETGEIQRQRVYMGDFPYMTEQGTFIINGAERVVVSQLVRSPGVYYTKVEDPATGRDLYNAKVIPNRGAWLEFETAARGQLYVKVDRKRKLEATKLLRAVGWESNDEMSALFSRVDTGEIGYIASTLEKDATNTRGEALIEVYKKLRPGDPPTGDNAEKLVESLFFNFRRYDLGRVGRYKLNKKLSPVAERMGINLNVDRTLSREDVAAIVGQLIELNNGLGTPDDIDHLGNRRIRANGELIQNAFRVGLLRMERVVRERMSIQEPDKATPNALVNIRPVVAAMKEFFGGSQLSQFMDQTNPLAELTSKRRLSALGPGGLSRERAGFDVRDVHHSHYGRICPIETPEGPNIGLIGSLATYGRINEYGFIETPYRKVKRTVAADDPNILEETADADVATKSGKVVLKKGKQLTKEAVTELKRQKTAAFPIRPRVTDEIVYLAADEEEEHYVAQANAKIDEATGHFLEDRVPTRYRDAFPEARPNQIEYMDVSPKQVVSVATALIPFLEHDDANRALMGSNMQRQAVPLLEPEAPIVGTGMEARAALDSGQVLTARAAGVVTSVTAERIQIESDSGELEEYRLEKFVRSNQGTCINQRPIVEVGARVEAGQPIADSSSTDGGELALGRNILVAFMSWEGGNYEDAIVLSDRLVREDLYTSIHIEKHEIESRDTKLGPEEITRDIPNVGEESLKDLDEDGIVYIGAEVQPGDILVGKITPKGETELTAEERLLRAIFGEKAREVKDSSLRLPHGERGKIVDVREFNRERGDELLPGVNRLIRVSVAAKRKISVGDKMAGRHGNKGVVAKILPQEDMPFLPDGTPVDIILNPLGVPSRMNIGQILETHLGWALMEQGRQDGGPVKAATAVFDGASEEEIRAELAAAEHTVYGERQPLPQDGKAELRDGRTGERFDRPVTVGYIYMMKLHHLVEDKIHARSTGPYSLITQQPLGGKAQFGGQRFGEMEVWALEAYGAANILQELLTVKSDDVMGRVQTYEAIVKGEDIQPPGVPESFKVLIKELQSLGLNVEILNENEEEIHFAEDASAYPLPDLGGINLAGFED
ncbi:MAG TPA: DNA-directed RNA polymerase subunit beta [Candidatus Limnocylindria bacterium]|nr:DNA-directed RNA polymerase subunit beta [Candidatus Limnocylindria bacterium]